MEIVDPDLIEYPQDQLIRFINVALFCTQSASQRRPDMKQVVTMLSKDVVLNDSLLTEPGVYRPRTSQISDDGSLHIASSSQLSKGKQLANPLSTSTLFDSHQSITESEMIPR